MSTRTSDNQRVRSGARATGTGDSNNTGGSENRNNSENSENRDNSENSGKGATAGFPTGVLESAERAFQWLCAGPHPVAVDGRALPGLPNAAIPLDELRARLLDPMTPSEVRDRAWAYLVRRARTDGPSWTVACAGMALPMLAGLARTLTARFAADPADIHAEIVCGFLAELPVLDPDRAFVSLRWAAYRAGHAALTAALDAPRPVDPTGETTGDLSTANDRDRGRREVGDATRRAARWDSTPPRTPGHPDLVLAAAVAAGALTESEAGLIGSTRLEPMTLEQAAAALGVPRTTVWSRRYRAEGRLLSHLSHHTSDTSDTSDTDGSGGSGSGRAGRSSARSAVRVRTTSSRARRRRRSRRSGTTGSGPVSSGPVSSGRAGSAASTCTSTSTVGQEASR